MDKFSIYANGTYCGAFFGLTADAAIQTGADEFGTDGNTDGMTAVAGSPQERITAMIAGGVFHGDLCDMVREKFNCEDVDIDDEGDIWIAKPQTGHWLRDEKVAEFADWAVAQ